MTPDQAGTLLRSLRYALQKHEREGYVRGQIRAHYEDVTERGTFHADDERYVALRRSLEHANLELDGALRQLLEDGDEVLRRIVREEVEATMRRAIAELLPPVLIPLLTKAVEDAVGHVLDASLFSASPDSPASTPTQVTQAPPRLEVVRA